MRKKYIVPETFCIKTEKANLLNSSQTGSIIYDANTQQNHQGPPVGGDEVSDGGDLEGAKKNTIWLDD